MKVLSEMSMILVKMSIQNVEYCKWSPSIVVLASFYAATTFLKHSKKFNSAETATFTTEVRKLILKLVSVELADQEKVFAEQGFTGQLQSLPNAEHSIAVYQKQFNEWTIGELASNLIEFYKMFDDWHCGLNQLKKFT